jgi:uncharacterized membrane protein
MSNEGKTDRSLAVTCSIVVGTLLWFLVVSLVARISFPSFPRLDDYLLSLSFPVSSLIAGLISYHLTKNYVVFIITAIITIAVTISLTILIFAMAGGGMR